MDSNKRKPTDNEEPDEPNKLQKTDYIPEFAPIDYSKNIQILSEEPINDQDTVGKKAIVKDSTTRFEGIEYQYFGIQPPAFDYVQQLRKDIPCFAQDKKKQVTAGSKGYIVAHYKEAFERINNKYKTMGRDMMKGIPDLIPALYELQRGHRFCNLFFDLEYDYEPNKGVNAMKLVKKFVDDVLEFCILMGITNEERGNVETLVLYSKNNSKASYHVHIIFSDHVFENVYHVGALVRNFAMWCIEKYGQPDPGDNPYYLLEMESGERKFFADLGIYTSNRPFRTAYCAKDHGKFNKTPLLLITDWNAIEYNPKNIYKVSPELVIFLKSCPQYIEHNGKYNLIKMKNPDGSSPVSTSYLGFWRNGGSMSNGGRMSGGFVKLGNANDPTVRVCMDIVREILPSTTLYFVSHSKEEQYVVVGTYSRKCPYKEHLLKKNDKSRPDSTDYLQGSRNALAEHKSNHVHYIVYYMGEKIRLKCKDDSCQSAKFIVTLNFESKWTQHIYKTLDPSEIFIDEPQLIKSMNMMCEYLQNLDNATNSPLVTEPVYAASTEDVEMESIF